jgi:hypothetical protein
MGPVKLPDAVRALRHWICAPVLLPTDEDMAGIVSRRGRGAMLLDRYSAGDVLEALERYGIRPKLRARGFERVEVALDTADPDHQSVHVEAGKGRRRWLLGETILRDGTLVTDAPFAGSLRGRTLRMLVVQWMRLQDPTRPFTSARPALPGQEHPGLGCGREVMDMLLGLAARLDFAGIMVCPEFAHNALIYSSQFGYFDPAAQGRFEALAGLLDSVPFALLAWAVQTGCVLDESTGRPFMWFHEEMIRPTNDLVQRYLGSARYREGVEASRALTRLRLDRDRLAAIDPLNPDGSPRVGC